MKLNCRNSTTLVPKTDITRREYQRLYHREYSKLPKNRTYAENYQLIRYYGISVKDYHMMMDQQDNKCAICKRCQSEFTKKFAVDHNHVTGKIRGLLCSHCNSVVLQIVEKYSYLIPKAQEYLNKP